MAFSSRVAGTTRTARLMAHWPSTPSSRCVRLRLDKVAPDIDGEDADGRSVQAQRLSRKGRIADLFRQLVWPLPHMYTQERELVSVSRTGSSRLLSVNTDPERETLLKSIRDGEITWRGWWDGGRNGPITSRWNVRSFLVFVIDAVRSHPRGRNAR